MSWTADWRTPNTEEPLQVLDRCGFALEFLRRNPAYRAEHDRLRQVLATDAAAARIAACDLARRWGLGFCRRP
jgi:hypothetical protein